MIQFFLKLISLYNGAVTSSGVASTALDSSIYGGSPLYVLVNARSGGTNNVTITAEHSADNSAWGAVPASALFDVATGDALTFAVVGASASSQLAGVNTQQLKRYFRINMTGTTLSGHNFAVTVGVQPLRADTV